MNNNNGEKINEKNVIFFKNWKTLVKHVYKEARENKMVFPMMAHKLYIYFFIYFQFK